MAGTCCTGATVGADEENMPMSSQKLDDSSPGLPFREGLYHLLLEETREVADRALDRLRDLSKQLPSGALEQVERLHDDPVHERRKAARVGEASLTVAVRREGSPEGGEGSTVKDRCPTGMAVLLPCPAGVGTLLRVRMPPEVGAGGWVTVEVRYCRREGEAWVVGCELLRDQPLL